MDRRSFIFSLLGGLTAASVGGIALTTQADAKPLPTPEPADAAKIDAGRLDEAEADYAQYGYRRRRYYRRSWRRGRGNARFTRRYPYNNDRRTRPER